MRNKVDLPQPDGPTSTMNSPSPIARSAPGSTVVAPNLLTTFLSSTAAIDASGLER